MSSKSCCVPTCALKLVCKLIKQTIPWYLVIHSTTRTLPSALFCTSFTCQKFSTFWTHFSLLRRRDGSNWVSCMSTIIQASFWYVICVLHYSILLTWFLSVVLLAQYECWLRWRYLFDHCTQRPYPYNHVHILLCHIAREGDLVEIRTDNGSDDSVCANEFASNLLVGSWLQILPTTHHTVILVLHCFAVVPVCEFLHHFIRSQAGQEFQEINRQRPISIFFTKYRPLTIIEISNFCI